LRSRTSIPAAGDDLEQRSTGELVEHLAGRLAELARAEVELVKADTVERARGLATAGVAGATAGVLGLAVVGAVVAGVILALDLVMPAWAAALVAAAAFALLAGALGLVARSFARRTAPPIPKTAMHQLKLDVEWLASRKRSSNGSS
jgi:Putative Actinobacterial Holin-X, holin superfamily III